MAKNSTDSHGLANTERKDSTPRIGVVGLGLIGGSYLKALISHGTLVYGYDPNPETMQLAFQDGMQAELTEKNVRELDLVILASYPAASIEWLARNAQALPDSILVIDTGGIKRKICQEAEALALEHGFSFIGTHPMSGTHLSGYKNSLANMFYGAPLVVCSPTHPRACPHFDQRVEQLKELLEPCAFGSVCIAEADVHDQIIAFSSQLAHVVSNAYVKSPRAQLHHGFSAGSYKDLTRVAQLNADMWTELFMENADNLSREIEDIVMALNAYKEALDAQDANKLHALLQEGDAIKRKLDRGDL